MKQQDIPFILEGSAWPALMLDESGVIRRVNQAATYFFGPTVASGASLAAIWAPDNEVTAESFFQKWRLSPTPAARVKLLVKGTGTKLLTASLCVFTLGELKFCIFQVMPQEGGSATASSSQGTAVDYAAAQKQKLDCALQLTRTVSLDFNNALTSILGHTSHVLSQMEAGNPWRASLVEVEKSAGRAAEIAHDLAAFSLQEKDTQGHATGNLNNLLRRVSGLFQNAPVKIQWQLQFEPKIYSAKFDEAKMQQAFTRIIENAVQSLTGDGKITLRTRNHHVTETTAAGTMPLAPGYYVCVEVTDTGCGIERASLSRVFEPFFTTKAGHRGVGLAWVYGIVTNHGGSVEVVSEPGAGTTVRVYLPGRQQVVKDTETELHDLGGTKTILMVDDEEILLTMAEMVLPAFGYKVLTAKSGKKALEVFQANIGKIDLVLTDLVMPNMGGRELIEKLKQISPNVRILCMSGYVRSSKAGEEELYLQKPFTSQDLLRKVKQALARQEG